MAEGAKTRLALTCSTASRLDDQPEPLATVQKFRISASESPPPANCAARARRDQNSEIPSLQASAGRKSHSRKFPVDFERVTAYAEGIWRSVTPVVAQFTAFDGVIIASSMSSCAARRSSLMLWA